MATYTSHGKLLLTGEYAVLDGALALALPTRYGQSMEVASRDQAGLSWKSLDPDGSIWFEGNFYQDDSGTVDFEGKPAHFEIGQRLKEILSTAQILRSEPNIFMFRHNVTTKLDFNRDWGLGSSSTLVHNISKWLGVDPYALLFDTLGGSGYDVACAAADGPILYQLTDRSPSISRVVFDPAFKEAICFVYLGQKKKSSEAISHYRQMVREKSDFLETISSLTKKLLACTELEEFEDLLEAHEELLSELLEMPRVQQQFPDYPGVLKSLGAWGGDFILATRAETAQEYFKKKGLTPVIPFSEMVL